MDSIGNHLSRLFGETTFPENAFFASKVLDGKEIIIYGAGEGFHWVAEILMRHYNYIPTIVLDRMLKKGDLVEGIPGCSPDSFVPSTDQLNNAQVIVSVGKPEYHAEIVKQLSQMGFRHILLMRDIYEIHNPFSLPETLQSLGYKYYLDQESKIRQATQLFRDDESIEVFLSVLETHMRRIPVTIPSRPRNEQYFPSDIRLSKGYSRFINCGAYDGDTLRLLNQIQGTVEDIICFETEPQLYKQLTEYVRKNKNKLARNHVITFPCAVYGVTSLVPFISGGGLGSRVSPEGDINIQSVALDDAIHGFKPSFVNMDIEGAELEALKGAENLIRHSRPDLGICVYHSPNHLWDIPLFLDGLDLGYQFYLRNYTSFTSETVLYATADC